MARTSSGRALGVAVLAAAWWLGPGTAPGLSQAPAPGDKKEKADAPTELRRAAERLVDTIELEVLTGDKWAKAKRLDQPLMLFSDNTRDNDRGSVWAWADKGRPLALFEMFQKLNDRTIWVVGICNTSGRKLRAGRAGAEWWQENDSDVVFKDVPSAPPVAAEAVVRQRQLKQLATKFTSYEIYNPNNTRYDLRRLDRPLHAYRDEPGGIVDGGLFAFANGTNPEVMLFIEARADPKGTAKPVWQFGVGRTSFAESHVECDGKEVYMAPRGGKGVTGPDKPFWTTVLQTGGQ